MIFSVFRRYGNSDKVFAPVIKAMAPAFATHLGLDPPTNMAQAQFVEQQVIYWFAILVAINLQTSFLSPPFGFALFYMKGVAPKITLWLPAIMLE